MTIKKLDDSRVEVKSTVAWSDWKNLLNEAVKEASKEMKIEGFRPGKAPREIVEKKVGKDVIFNAAAEKAIAKDYPEILKKEEINAIGAPQIKIDTLEEEKDLEYTAISTIMPEIKLGSWKNEVAKVNKEFAKKKIEITNEELTAELDKLANSRVKTITVKRAAKKGDAIQVDFKVSKGGVPIEGGTANDHNLVLGNNVFIPGFEDEVVGMKDGDEKEFDLKFPNEYHEKNLAGQKAHFEVKMKLVQKREIPEMDDEFAKSLGEFKNIEALKKNIKEGLKKEREAKSKEEKRGEITEKLIEKTEVKLPEILIHEELHKMEHELESQIQGMGMQLDQYLQQMKKTREDLEKDWKPQAEKRLKAALALEQVAKDREINVKSEDIEEEMNKTMQYYKDVKDAKKNIDMKRLYDYTKAILQSEAVFKELEKI
jgi:trigger factor